MFLFASSWLYVLNRVCISLLSPVYVGSTLKIFLFYMVMDSLPKKLEQSVLTDKNNIKSTPNKNDLYIYILDDIQEILISSSKYIFAFKIS